MVMCTLYSLTIIVRYLEKRTYSLIVLLHESNIAECLNTGILYIYKHREGERHSSKIKCFFMHTITILCIMCIHMGNKNRFVWKWILRNNLYAIDSRIYLLGNSPSFLVCKIVKIQSQQWKNWKKKLLETIEPLRFETRRVRVFDVCVAIFTVTLYTCLKIIITTTVMVE